MGVPGQLYALLEDPLWLGQYDSVAVWVIDSFWNERIPKVLRGTRRIDWIWVTDSNDVTDWQNFFGSRVGVLPWGTDAKAVNSDYPPGQKSVDLLRVGRQPIAYEDDELIKADASKLGVSFAGRPNFGSNEDESSRNLHSALAESKAVLAFSNIYDTTTYTHPSKEYVTGRWMDSLAHGAAVAGVLPNTDTARSLVPPIGRILLDARDREAGLRSVRDWAEEWHLGTSTEIRKFAIENLDWRHRLSVVDKHFELHSETLANEIVELKRISANLDVR
ncbi:glycosyltransferase family 1 protein [Neomicrococcus aestuarii]|uniref:glycosyltransferase family 1 protein n=1 Tax=Neomicrococcus aestuarii TaxID=556325 RepID=UPI0012EE4D35|nr:glycosyltransferase family 1 protein [Neomicrococcus aestuarii]